MAPVSMLATGNRRWTADYRHALAIIAVDTFAIEAIRPQ